MTANTIPEGWKIQKINCMIGRADLDSEVIILADILTLIKRLLYEWALRARNKVLTAKLLRQGYRYYNFPKAFSNFYLRHFDLVSKYNVGSKTLLLQSLSDYLVYKFRNIIGKNDFLIISKR